MSAAAGPHLPTRLSIPTPLFCGSAPAPPLTTPPLLLLTGVDPFDLARLEAAVSAIPPSAYKGEQAALTQASQSMVFRWAVLWHMLWGWNGGVLGELGGLGPAAWLGVWA